MDFIWNLIFDIWIFLSREIKYLGIILKKQALGETDEIITLYTKERGKVRLLAKSVKSSKSKFQQKLQALFLIEVRAAGGRLPKIIGVETIKVYAPLRENLVSLKTAFVASELVLKFAPDEEKNERLFEILETFLEFINGSLSPEITNLALAKLKIAVLNVSGFSTALPQDLEGKKQLFFSARRGGFSLDPSDRPISAQVFNLFLRLKEISLKDISAVKFFPDDAEAVQRFLSELIEYHLERRLKSEKYLEN